MKMKMNGSIYQGNMREAGAGAGMGLIMEGGRLVNKRPDGVMGIQHIAAMRKAIKHEAKVNTYAEGVMRGERMSEMNEMMMGCSCGKPNCNCYE